MKRIDSVLFCSACAYSSATLVKYIFIMSELNEDQVKKPDNKDVEYNLPRNE